MTISVSQVDEKDVSDEVKRHVTDDDVVYMRFSVADTGVGIPNDKLNRLFLPFTQVDR